MIGFSIFLGVLGFFIFRRFWKESDLDPILWKWFVRLIWFGSIAFFRLLNFSDISTVCPIVHSLAFTPGSSLPRWCGLSRDCLPMSVVDGILLVKRKAFA